MTITMLLLLLETLVAWSYRNALRNEKKKQVFNCVKLQVFRSYLYMSQSYLSFVTGCLTWVKEFFSGKKNIII